MSKVQESTVDEALTHIEAAAKLLESHLPRTAEGLRKTAAVIVLVKPLLDTYADVEVS